jgi:2-amino-4-hydroxy-6-hydroxymethyldihydropteridine diphosphokinase/dihydropteroate synthase
MGNPVPVSHGAENVRSKRMTPLSHFKAFARRFSSGIEPRMDSKMNSVQGGSQVHRAFIALGSNVGDRVEMIEKACLELDRANIKVKRTSSLFETTPMYVLEQGTFINGVCEVIHLVLFEFDHMDKTLITYRLKPPSGQWSFWTLSNLSRMRWAERS